MSRFNKRPSGLFVPSPIVSEADSAARTGNNAPGFTRDARSELFLLAVSNFVGQDKFYESGTASDNRFSKLVHQVAVEDPDWMKRFLPWLRNEANMRTASMVGLVEAVEAMVAAKIPGGRRMTYFTITRADEPGEIIAYLFKTYKRRIPKPIKRGIADAIQGLYGEYQTLKYDTESHGVRFGDVLELVHAKPRDAHQSVLFKHLIDRRHKRNEGIPSSLPIMHLNAKLRELAAMGDFNFILSPASLREAGMTWEDVLSLAGSKVDKRLLWEAMIPNMGYMASLRNLRNFDEAGVDDVAASMVIEKLTNPDAVESSRQLPFRFLSAFRAVSSLRWAWALEKALQLSLRNVPEFTGRTLVLVDQSPSMFPGYHFSTPNKSDITLADQAKIFGTALALRAQNADLVQYGGTWEPVKFHRSDSLLKVAERFRMIDSTNTEGAVRHNYYDHDRVVIVTDEQANHHGYRDVTAAVPANKLVVTFNLGGYSVGHAPSGTGSRVTIGGVSDQAFKLLPMLEKRQAGQWPF